MSTDPYNIRGLRPTEPTAKPEAPKPTSEPNSLQPPESTWPEGRYPGTRDANGNPTHPAFAGGDIDAKTAAKS